MIIELAVNNKIIGFTISVSPVDHSDVDLFTTGFSYEHLEHAGYHIYLWGLGDLGKMRHGPRISLSFPLTFSLEDRNVVISLGTDGITVQNDWLGSIPVFYNIRTRSVSTLVGKITAWQDNPVDPEGLANYLDFGYAIFEQTPLATIKFMRYASKLTLTSHALSVDYQADPVLSDPSKETSPKQVLTTLKEYVHTAEERVTGEIIIPTSGGFDSRILNLLVNDKNRIRSFTYGVSRHQEESYEVVKAQTLSHILKTRWQQITLKDAARYWADWFAIYGGAVHLHGMYHIEFFKNIRTHMNKTPQSLLSGIFGDVWSGFVDIPPIEDENDLQSLGYTHGLVFGSRYMRGTHPNEIKKRFFTQAQEQLANPSGRILAAIRLKIILISYLMSLPDYFGFPSWTPFLNKDIVFKMLALPPEQKKDRIWQRQFFKEEGVDLESRELTFTMENTSDANLLWENPIPPLRVGLLQPYIRAGMLRRVNGLYQRLVKAKGPDYRLVNKLLKYRVIGPLLIRLNIKPKDYLEPYNQFIVLKSFELSLEKLRR